MPGFAIETHPQKAKIVDWILAGHSTRDIASKTVPPVSFNAIQRYKTNVIKPMLERAEESKRIIGEKPRRVVTPVPREDAPEAVQAVQNAILDAPAIHIRENRIKLQQELTKRLTRVVNERAADMSVCEQCRRPRSAHPWEEMKDGVDKEGLPIQYRVGCDEYRMVPGGETGLVIRKLKATGIEYAVDTAVLAEIREQEKHVAIELGVWNEGATTGSVSIQIVCPSAGAPAGELPRVSFASTDQIEAAPEDADEISEIGLVQKSG
jgi:hypothetical protein